MHMIQSHFTHDADGRCCDSLSNPRQHSSRDDNNLTIGVQRVHDEGFKGRRETLQAPMMRAGVCSGALRRGQKGGDGMGRDECKANDPAPRENENGHGNRAHRFGVGGYREQSLSSRGGG